MKCAHPYYLENLSWFFNGANKFCKLTLAKQSIYRLNVVLEEAFVLLETYARVASELSDWKRLVLAARECHVKGNEEGAAELYRRALNCAKHAGLESSEELISFLKKELWTVPA